MPIQLMKNSRPAAGRKKGENKENMKFYLAPLEGITGYVYRNALEHHFPGTDRYFTPFIAPDQNKILRTRETRDVLPENNAVRDLVPQILTNNPEHFLNTVKVLWDMGYQEVNLNLGCPSGTVVSRKRGAGFLACPDELDRFLEKIFAGTNVRISIKTRIGKDQEEEGDRLMEIYRKYPLSELIIHPRLQKDFYRGTPRLDAYSRMLDRYLDPKENREASDRVCYNGNLLTEKDYLNFIDRFQETECVMLGRGVIANPGLIHQIQTGEPTDKKTLRNFCDEVLEGYRIAFSDDRNALFRMKEMWTYMIHLFTDHEKYGKKIRKASGLGEYLCAVDALFREQELLTDGPIKWNLPQR